MLSPGCRRPAVHHNSCQRPAAESCRFSARTENLQERQKERGQVTSKTTTADEKPLQMKVQTLLLIQIQHSAQTDISMTIIIRNSQENKPPHVPEVSSFNIWTASLFCNWKNPQWEWGKSKRKDWWAHLWVSVNLGFISERRLRHETTAAFLLFLTFLSKLNRIICLTWKEGTIDFKTLHALNTCIKNKIEITTCDHMNLTKRERAGEV